MKKKEILESCRDYEILKKELTTVQLTYINNTLVEYSNYINKNNDGKIDTIDYYTKKYGNANIIDWFEGLKDTREFIEDYLTNTFEEEIKNGIQFG